MKIATVRIINCIFTIKNYFIKLQASNKFVSRNFVKFDLAVFWLGVVHKWRQLRGLVIKRVKIGEGVSKIVHNCVTSFMDDPLPVPYIFWNKFRFKGKRDRGKRYNVSYFEREWNALKKENLFVKYDFMCLTPTGIINS